MNMKQHVASEDYIDKINFVPTEQRKYHSLSDSDSPVSYNIISQDVILDPQKERDNEKNKTGVDSNQVTYKQEGSLEQVHHIKSKSEKADPSNIPFLEENQPKTEIMTKGPENNLNACIPMLEEVNVGKLRQKQKEYEFNFVKAFEIAKQKCITEAHLEEKSKEGVKETVIIVPKLKNEKKKFPGMTMSLTTRHTSVSPNLKKKKFNNPEKEKTMSRNLSNDNLQKRRTDKGNGKTTEDSFIKHISHTLSDLGYSVNGNSSITLVKRSISPNSARAQEDLTSSRSFKGHASTTRSQSRPPFEKLKLKLEEDFIQFLQKHRYSAILMGNKKYEGKTGNYYLMMKKQEEDKSLDNFTNLDNPGSSSGLNKGNVLNEADLISSQGSRFNINNDSNINKKWNEPSHTDNDMILAQEDYTRPNAPLAEIQNNTGGVNKQTTQGRTKMKKRSGVGIEQKRDVYPTSKKVKKQEGVPLSQNLNVGYVITNLETKGNNDGNKMLENNPQYKSIRNLLGDTSIRNDLTPIPSKNDRKNKFADAQYIQAERAAVLIRRIEYSYNMKNQKYNASKEAEMIYLNLLFEAKAVLIQRWWRRFLKRRLYKELQACKIQNVFRGFLTRIMVKTSIRQMNDIFPFLSSVFFVIEKRKIISAFSLLYNLFAIKSQDRASEFKRMKLGRMIALLGKPEKKEVLSRIRKKFDTIKKVIAIQSAFRGVSYRSNPKRVLAAGRDVHPFMYYFLTYNNPRMKKENDNIYYIKLNRFLQMAKILKYGTLRKKINPLFNVIKQNVSHVIFRYYFVNFTQRLFKYRYIQIKIKKITKGLKKLLPLITKNYSRMCLHKWKQNYWTCKNYCRLGISLFGKYLKFCYWKKLKNLLKGIDEDFKIRKTLRRVIRFKANKKKLEMMRKLKKFVKLGRFRERKLLKLIIRKNLLIKRRVLKKIGKIVFYKNIIFYKSYRLSKGFEILKKFCLRKIIAGNPFTRIRKLFLKARIICRMRNNFKISSRCKTKKFHKVFLEWLRIAITRKTRSTAQIAKLKECVSMYQKKIEQILKKKFKNYHISTFKHVLAEKSKLNQTFYMKSFSLGSLILSKYANRIYEHKAVDILRNGEQRISLRIFLIALLVKVTKILSMYKFTTFLYISHFARKKHMKKISLKKLFTKKHFDLHERKYNYFQIFKKGTFGEYISIRKRKILNDEEKDKNKKSLLSQFLLTKVKKLENILNYFYQRWKENLAKEKIAASSMIISLHSRQVLQTIQQNKAVNTNNEMQMSIKEHLGKIINNKIEKYVNFHGLYFSKWKRRACKMKMAIPAGIIQKFCRKIQRKIYFAKLTKIFFIPFLRRLLKREFLLFAKKKINARRACKLLHEYYLAKLQNIMGKIKIRAHLALMAKRPSQQQTQELKDTKLKLLIISRIRKREAIVFMKFHHWRNLIAKNQILLSARKVGMHARKVMRKIKLRKSCNLIQIRELLRISARVNKLRRFKQIFKRVIFNTVISLPYTRIKKKARCSFLGRVIQKRIRQRVRISFILWKLISRLFDYKSKVIQSSYRKFNECLKKENIQLKNKMMKALLRKLFEDKEKMKKFYWTMFKRMTNIMRTKINGSQTVVKTKNRQVYKNKKIGMLKYLVQTFEKNHLTQDVYFIKMANRFKFWKNFQKIKKLKYAVSYVNKGFGAVIYFHSSKKFLKIYLIKWKKNSKVSFISQKVTNIQRIWRYFKNSRMKRKEVKKNLYTRWNLFLENSKKMEYILTRVCILDFKKKFIKKLVLTANLHPRTQEQKDNILRQHLINMIQRNMWKYFVGKITRYIAIKRTQKKMFLLGNFLKKKERLLLFSVYKAFNRLACANKKTKLLNRIHVIQRFIKDRQRINRRLKIFTSHMKLQRKFKKYLVHRIASKMIQFLVKVRNEKIQIVHCPLVKKIERISRHQYLMAITYQICSFIQVGTSAKTFIVERTPEKKKKKNIFLIDLIRCLYLRTLISLMQLSFSGQRILKKKK